MNIYLSTKAKALLNVLSVERNTNPRSSTEDVKAFQYGRDRIFIITCILKCYLKYGVKQIPVTQVRKFIKYADYFKQKTMTISERIPLMKFANLIYVSPDVL